MRIVKLGIGPALCALLVAPAALAAVILDYDNRSATIEHNYYGSSQSFSPVASWADFQVLGSAWNVEHFSTINTDYVVMYGDALVMSDPNIPSGCYGTPVFNAYNGLGFRFVLTSTTTVSVAGFLRGWGWGGTDSWFQILSLPGGTPVYEESAGSHTSGGYLPEDHIVVELDADLILPSGSYLVAAGTYGMDDECSSYSRADMYYELAFDGATVPPDIYEVPNGNPVPEPGMWAQLSSGSVLLMLLHRYRVSGQPAASLRVRM